MLTEPALSALVIGCGRIAGGHPDEDARAVLSHAAAYRQHDRFTLSGCIDPDEKQRSAFAARWDVAECFIDIGDAFAEGGHWDVASVCTPTGQHAADLWALLKTPVRAVWCEKPITGSVSESAELVAAYIRAGKHLAVNHLRRWNPAMETLRQQIADGAFGDVHSIIGFYTKGVRNNGSHLIDLIQFLVGPIAPGSASIARPNDGIGDPDDPTVDAMLHTGPGAPVHLVSGDARDFALFELEIIAAKAAVRIERSGRTIRVRRPIDDPDNKGYRILDGGETTEIGIGNVFERAADNLYRAVTENAPLACDGATALATEKICEELITQSRTTNEVSE